MLASINPLGERARNRRWSRTVSAYLVGSVLGGAMMGALAGLVGGLVRSGTGDTGGTGWAWSAAIVVVVCGLGLAADLGLGGLRLPTVRRQVDKDWLDRYRGWVYGLSFGFQLGLGVVTVVNTAATYATFVLALVSGSASVGIVIGTTFGLIRGLVILSVRGVDRPEQLRGVHRRMQSWAARSFQMSLGAQALVALAVAAVAVGR